MNTNEVVKAVIKKDGIDEGMAQILELLMSYNVNDEEWLNNIITNLCYNSVGKDVTHHVDAIRTEIAKIQGEEE
tara:strand:+ start:7268 stop:7489 length:222 start_codon:yes stop_codon:yes gene_type:complete